MQVETSLAFLPIGPLEWHGPHLPIGTDALIAQAVAAALAERLNGTLLPPLFADCAPTLNRKVRDAIGIPENQKNIIGMDFAPQAFPNAYLRMQTLEALLRACLDALFAQGYRRIVCINGHGWNAPVLNHVCTQYPARKVMAYPALLPLCESDPNSGHGTRMETAAVLALAAGLVDLTQLPPKGKNLLRTIRHCRRSVFSGRSYGRSNGVCRSAHRNFCTRQKISDP